MNSNLLHVEFTGTRLTLLDFWLKLVAALLESSALPAYNRSGRPQALIVQLTCLEGIFLATYLQQRQKKDHSVEALSAHQKETERIRDINVKPVLCAVPCFKAVVPNRGTAAPWGASCNAQGCREMLQYCGLFLWLKLRPNSSSIERNYKHCIV